MRQYIIAAAAAVGIIALWAAIVPRAEAPSAGRVAAPSPAMTNALRLCRSHDQACVRALATAQALDARGGALVSASEARCNAERQLHFCGLL